MTPSPPPRSLIDRHLGMPAGLAPDPRVDALVDDALRWYGRSGDPWRRVRRFKIAALTGDRVELDGGPTLEGFVLARGLRHARAHAVLAGAFTAGAAVDSEASRRWSSDRPDEAFVVGALGSALVESLRGSVAEDAAELLDGEHVLPHWSPGYPGWPLHDQHALARALELDRDSPIELEPSGALRPSKSTLALFPVTRVTLDEPLEEFWPRRCRPHRAETESPFPERALEKWARERLLLERRDGRLRARFRFDGTTCASPGHELPYEYTVELDDIAGEHRIARMACEPAGDGHRASCAFMQDAEAFERAAGDVPPLVGRSLDDALGWTPESASIACLCTAAARNHKWRIVLHTLHRALRNSPAGVHS